MAKFGRERNKGCFTQFEATSSPGSPAEGLETPLIIFNSDSEVTQDSNQKVAGELKMQFSPASEDIDPLILDNDNLEMAKEVKMQAEVIPTSAPTLPLPGTHFLEAIEEATREAYQQMGSSSPAWSADTWDVSFQRKVMFCLAKRLPSLINYHGLDQVRIQLADGCPNHYHILGEKYKMKWATTVWGLCMKVSPDSLTTPILEYSGCCNEDEEIKPSAKAAAWRPWQ